MSKVILVCGLPGSGKTTLANRLSAKLNIVALHKDSIKENLYEQMGLQTLGYSNKLGVYSAELLLALGEEQVRYGTDVILESPFSYAKDHEIFKKWIDEYKVEMFVVICSVSSEIREDRYISRPRHAAHHDSERTRSFENDLEKEELYNQMPGNKIKIVTDKPEEENLQEVLDFLIKI